MHDPTSSATSFETPFAESLLINRLVRIDVRRSEVDLGRLSELQKQRGLLAHAMRAYIKHLQVGYHHYEAELPKKLEEIHVHYLSVGTRLRQPYSLAMLELGVHAFLECARLHLLINEEEADAISRRARAALLRVAARNSAEAQKSDPAAVFVETLRSLLAQGRVKLTSYGQELATESVPGGCEAIGWRGPEEERPTGSARYAFLEPQLAYRAVVQFVAATGAHFATSKNALTRLLHGRGWIVPPDREGDKRLEFEIKVGGTRHRVLRMPLEVLLPSDEDGVDEVHPAPAAIAEQLLNETDEERRSATIVPFPAGSPRRA